VRAVQVIGVIWLGGKFSMRPTRQVPSVVSSFARSMQGRAIRLGDAPGFTSSGAEIRTSTYAAAG
jgi:hypothetical protein